ncbi:MAG: glycosyltransferase, partial [Candidatus Hydrogenedentes bacterium]|nr:glycosyltransferase [Candidatus Hydrogenedentota bacterium]
ENWRHMPYWKDIAPHYDYFFHIQPGPFAQKLNEIGCRYHAPLPTGCDPEAHAPVTLSVEEQEKYGCDIAFAGAGYPNRNEFFKGLTDYDFKLWGVNWNPRELQKCVCDSEERFSTEKYMKIVAGAKININLHSSAQSDGIDPECDAVNPRVFEIAAGGGFQLCDPCKGLDDLFDFETELPVYRSLAELRKKIDHYLAYPDEREAIATAARERVLRDHTYERRAQQMLDLLLEKHGHRLLKQGVRVQKGIGEMVDEAKDLPDLQDFLKQLPQDALFTQENLAPLIRAMAPPRPYAANVFMYLNEVKEFAETLFKERR